MIRAILFDFDGVIVRSEPLHKQTFLEILSPYGVKVSEERWYQEFAGTGSRHIFRELMKEYGIDGDANEMAERRRKRFIELAKQGHAAEMPGLRDFLEGLKGKNMKTAIVSGGHRSYIELLLETMKLGGFFDLIVTADDIPERKPDPEPFLRASRALGIDAADCLVIEDSYAGCKAANSAGMKIVWMRPHSSMAPPECDMVIEDFRSRKLKELLG